MHMYNLSYIHVVACTQEFGTHSVSDFYFSCTTFPSPVIAASSRAAGYSRFWEGSTWVVHGGIYAHALGKHWPWCGSIILHKYV